LGFSLEEKQLKRAGLDYWPKLEWTYYENLAEWQEKTKNESRIFYLSKKGEHSLYDLESQPGDWFVFGKETKGLPEDLRVANKDRVFKLPFPGEVRSFNLANSVAMVLGEGLRQLSLASK